jgi:hypothetical protein
VSRERRVLVAPKVVFTSRHVLSFRRWIFTTRRPLQEGTDETSCRLIFVVVALHLQYIHWSIEKEILSEIALSLGTDVLRYALIRVVHKWMVLTAAFFCRF